MKKYLLGLVPALSVASVFAEGESHILPQTPAANGITAFTTLASDLTSWSAEFMPIILSVIGVFLVYWLIRFGLRLFKAFAGSGS